MTANTFQPNTYSKESGQISVTAVAVVLGLVLGGVFNLIWQGLPLLTLLGMWLLALAISFIAVTLINNRRSVESEWGLALVGQMIGMLAVCLIFIASVL